MAVKVLIGTPSNSGGSGQSNTSSNSGEGEGLALPKVGVDLPFKSLKVTGNGSISSDSDSVTIDIVGDVQSVSGDGVGGTPEDVIMTFPTPAEIGALKSGDNVSELVNDANYTVENSILSFTSNFPVPPNTNNKTITYDNVSDGLAIIGTTSFAKEGDSCIFTSINDGFLTLANGSGVVFNRNDVDGIATADFKTKGAMRLKDVGGDVVIDLF